MLRLVVRIFRRQLKPGGRQKRRQKSWLCVPRRDVIGKGSRGQIRCSARSSDSSYRPGRLSRRSPCQPNPTLNPSLPAQCSSARASSTFGRVSHPAHASAFRPGSVRMKRASSALIAGPMMLLLWDGPTAVCSARLVGPARSHRASAAPWRSAPSGYLDLTIPGSDLGT